MTETPTYYSAELLKTEHALRLCRNNASAFGLRAQLATTADAREDALGSQKYWSNQAAVQDARARHLHERLEAANRV